MPTYRKGEDQMPLQKRALEQRLEEASIRRSLSQGENYERDVETGAAGAKNVAGLNPTVAEATSNPDMLGGPVSGDALRHEKSKKSEARATKEREMKRGRKQGMQL